MAGILLPKCMRFKRINMTFSSGHIAGVRHQRYVEQKSAVADEIKKELSKYSGSLPVLEALMDSDMILRWRTFDDNFNADKVRDKKITLAECIATALTLY